MQVTEVQAIIAEFRATATTLEQLQELQEILHSELNATEVQIEAIETQEEEEVETQQQAEYEATEEGQEELKEWNDKIAIWYNTPEYSCSIYGNRRNPNKLEIVIQNRKDWNDFKELNAISMQQAIELTEQLVGTGTPHSSNPSAGFSTWNYRWYDYANSEWL